MIIPNILWTNKKNVPNHQPANIVDNLRQSPTTGFLTLRIRTGCFCCSLNPNCHHHLEFSAGIRTGPGFFYPRVKLGNSKSVICSWLDLSLKFNNVIHCKIMWSSNCHLGLNGLYIPLYLRTYHMSSCQFQFKAILIMWPQLNILVDI